MLRKLPLFFIAILFISFSISRAQEAPTTINNALADLSAKAGVTVTLADLDNWSFEAQPFPDASLGCPQPGQAYAQMITPGVKYLLTYQGAIYDYRVSDEGGRVVLCSTTPAPEVKPPCPPPGDTAYLPPRLVIGTQARVAAGGFPNNVRQLPGTSSVLLGEIPVGAVFNVLEGPECTTLDKLVWWRVDYNGLVGWTPEGQQSTYWLEPLNLTATPSSPQPQLQDLTPATARLLQQINGIEDETAVYSISPIGLSFAVGLPDGAVTLTEVLTGRELAQANAGAEVTSLAFGFNTRQIRSSLAAGRADGKIRFWEIGADGTLQERALLEGQVGRITRLAFGVDGMLLASGDSTGAIYLFDLTANTVAGILSGHTGAITDLQFWGDVLFSTDDAGGAKVWGIAPGNG